MSAPDFTALLRARIAAQPDLPALSGHGFQLSYRELGAELAAVTNSLRASGFADGGRMLFSIRPSPEAVILVLATIMANGTIVFIDPGMGPELFARRAALLGPAWVAAESLLYAAAAPGPLRAVAQRRGLTLPRLAALGLPAIHTGPWLPGVPRRSHSVGQLRRGSGPQFGPTNDPAAEALIVFTSGTTDQPKAVVHTRGSLGAAFVSLSTWTSLAPGARLVTDQLMVGLPALLHGAHWTMPRYRRLSAHLTPCALGKDLATATHTFLVPADVPALLAAITDGKVPYPSQLRQVLLGGAPVTPALLRRASHVLPDAELLAIYGMTEILPVAITTATAKLAYPGTGDPVGAPLPGINARIAADGELILSGPNLCQGYLGGGPMLEHHTGDLARLEDKGIVLTGRKKDMIIRGKTNIYPGLYEPAIEAITGVNQALLIGIPDDIGDERVILALATDGSTNVEDRVRQQLPALMDTAALPDTIVVVDDIPTSGRTRKPDRAALGALLAQSTRNQPQERHDLHRD